MQLVSAGRCSDFRVARFCGLDGRHRAVTGCFGRQFRLDFHWRGQAGKPHRRANLRRRQAFARSEFGDEFVTHLHAFERFANDTFTRAGRWAFQFEVIGKAAAKRGVDLANAVGHPDGGHTVRLQNLVHPGLTVDAAAGRRGHLLGARQQLRGFVRDGREHIFHLVKQQGRLRTAFQKHLGDLQRAVTVAATQGVAVAVSVFDLIQL